ncbi:hypothetical protein FACS1894122_02670 [Alphaproteobacteria bacterium]|nr:hypothetical protein FACS1894122_02670 [Alphaproteobacteria bacterium]
MLTVFDLFFKNQSFSKDAIISGDRRISYGELCEKVSARSQELAMNKPSNGGIMVIIHRSKKLDAIVDVLSCLNLGFAFLNLPYKYPQERIERIKNIIRPYAIITDESCIIHDEYKTYHDDLAYMIFTSGTTGEPKGVMISNNNLLSLLDALQNTAPTCVNTTMLQFASFSFDASIWEIFSTLCYGGTLVLTPENVVLLADSLAEFIRNNSINRALLTPVVARTIVSKNINTMKDLFIGGDAFHESILSDWSGEYNLWNAYGPTETTVCVIVHKFKKDDSIVLGKALFKNELSICNEELTIKGDQVGIGHISSDGTNLYNGVYNSGDVVSLDENGDFVFHGRKDDQIKIRGGYRVSLQEVKKNIESLKEIECAYVLAHSNGDTKEMYCFFEGKLSEKELEESVSKILPHHMVPSRFIRVDKWPLNSSDKIDRNKLIETLTIKQNIASVISRASVVELWKNILDVDAIDDNSNFFELGGQSFQALQIIQEYINNFGLSMELVDFFKNPTLMEQVTFFEGGNDVRGQ